MTNATGDSEGRDTVKIDLLSLEGYLGETPVRLSLEEMAEVARAAVARRAALVAPSG